MLGFGVSERCRSLVPKLPPGEGSIWILGFGFPEVLRSSVPKTFPVEWVPLAQGYFLSFLPPVEWVPLAQW